ncbi:unnamed protein product [Nezara viridula]|uniref:Uncharacterized protein n=1 Tax=Nezara viridula TaxID=85310 RepID=A0A9P0HTM0_NEZVI|nr:unnamed protein product [Nezara viridula]
MFLPPDPPLPGYDPCAGNVQSVERTLAKIKAASLRVGFNLWHIFKPLDPHDTNYMSESKFLSILLGPMKSIIGLDPFEIGEMTNYYKIADGRIAYTRLCQEVHEKLSPPGESDEDRKIEMMQSNKLGDKEDQEVKEILARISVSVTPRKLVVKPFFQDFELVKKDSGLVSKNTFVRVVHFMGVPLTTEEISLLLRKYRHDSDTVKYEAFLKEIDEVSQFLAENQFVDQYGALRDDYFGKVPSLPAMDMQPVPEGEQYGIIKICSDGFPGGAVGAAETSVAFNKIREQVLNEKLNVEDFFMFYDKMNTGRVTSEAMRSCIDWICVSETCFNDLFLTHREVELLVTVYADPTTQDKVLWKVFKNDLEQGIEAKELETWPHRGMVRKSANPYQVLYRPPTPPEDLSYLSLNDVLGHIKECMETFGSSRKLITAFASRDINGTAYLTVPQFEWVFLECGICLAPREKEILRERYEDEMGINWRFFAEDLKTFREQLTVDRQQKEMEVRRKAVEDEKRQRVESMEGNVIEILAKIKCIIVCKRVWIKDYLKVFDKHKRELITRSEFQRGLDQCGLRLSKKEIEILEDVFCQPNDPDMIEYNRFCRTVDEDSLPPCLTRPNIKDVIEKSERTESKIMPTHQWANFKKRNTLAKAMDKLSKYVGLSSTDLFKSLDTINSGTVSRSNVQKALFSLNCLHLISNNELDTIIHCFGFKKGHFLELDYMAFLNALDIVIKTKAAAKNL